MDIATNTFVVACDGSSESVRAAGVAAQLAKATGQPLKLLAVFSGSLSQKLIISGISSEELRKKENQFARKAFDAAREAVKEQADVADVIQLKGDPAREILAFLEANPGAHLVMGRRGFSLVRSLTFGSTSEKVVRHATGPVTVVSP